MKTLNRFAWSGSLVGAWLALAPLGLSQPVVKTVPFDPSNPAIPHDTFAGKTITLKGTSSVQGPNIQAKWVFGDGSPDAMFTVTNRFDVSTTHLYVGAINTIFTATLMVTDTNLNQSGSATYQVAMRAKNLKTETNVAIDEGLWYLHKTMNRSTIGVVDHGNWQGGCGAACDNISGSTAINASNLQAFEVNGHLESGAASNPYTETVARGMHTLFTQLTPVGIGPHTVFSVAGNPILNPDGNGNGIGIYAASSQNFPAFYQGGQFIDAIVASGTPNAVAITGVANVINRSYKDIVQDMVDAYLNCQYAQVQGGSWRYNCGDFPDNSAAQWAAIGIIAAVRGFGSIVPTLAYDANKVWVNFSQNAANGVFGYTSSSPIWGPYADTPSGMVQMAMNGQGRGDAHWDKAETFMRDNFGNTAGGCNPTDFACKATQAPKFYTYGLFSFTKAMLLHDPGGVLTPITSLHSQTLGVPDLDWYAAEVTAGDPTDGVARTLVNRQDPAGFWSGHSYYGGHFPFETGWSIIMLRRTVFIQCVTDLAARGTQGRSGAPARVDLTWTAINGATSYDVFRATASGGPYTKIGNSTGNTFSDTTGLVNGQTYYYVLKPLGVTGTPICQSNEAKATIPNQPGR
ncbi:MAG: PKD domain-containing protein [Acidobacteria bacterium]|nr:PKD domain-containing protein [Acidobacteriota bacterium]